MVFVGAGIGVTPFASVIESLRYQLSMGKDVDIDRLHFIWMIQEKDMLNWFGDMLAQLDKLWGQLTLHIFLTSRNRHDFRSLGFHLLTRLQAEADEMSNIQLGSIHIGRPNFKDIFHKIKWDHVDREESYGVFYCGNEILAKLLRDECEMATDPNVCTFDFYSLYF